jgi:cellulose synthase/poly-beta-1,6-N-acetylglucosamine synthase-like glycosyltransferase
MFIYLPLIILINIYIIIGAISLYFSKKYIIKRGNITNYPSISIIIPTYNEETIIEERLKSLLEIDYPKDKMEIIITDSSSDNTPKLINDFILTHRDLNIKIIHDDIRQGLAIALNKAYTYCNNEIIVKMDSDIKLAKDSLKNIISNFSDPIIGAVTGKIIVVDDNKVENSYRKIQDIIQRAESYIDSIYMTHTFVAYRRSLIRGYKPYHYGDETIQTIHIRRQGYKVIYDYTALFYEQVPKKDTLKQKIRRAEGHIRILSENIDMQFNTRYGRFGLYILPSNLFLIIIAPFLVFISIPLIILDFLIIRTNIILDLAIIVLLAIWIITRKFWSNPIFSLLELHYAQLIAIFNVIRGKKDIKWSKVERSSLERAL